MKSSYHCSTLVGAIFSLVGLVFLNFCGVRFASAQELEPAPSLTTGNNRGTATVGDREIDTKSVPWRKLVVDRFRIGLDLLAQVKYDDALLNIQGAYTLAERHVENLEAIDLPAILAYKAVVEGKLGQFQNSEKDVESCLKLLKNVPIDKLTAQVLGTCSVAYLEVQKPKEAEGCVKRSLEILEQICEPQDPELEWPLDILGTAYNELNRFFEAELKLTKVLAINEKNNEKKSNPDQLVILCHLARSKRELHKFVEAEELLKRAGITLELMTTQHSAFKLRSYRAAVTSEQANLLRDRGSSGEAEKRYKIAIELLESEFGMRAPALIPACTQYSILLRRVKRNDEAIVVEKRVAEIKKQCSQGKGLR